MADSDRQSQIIDRRSRSLHNLLWFSEATLVNQPPNLKKYEIRQIRLEVNKKQFSQTFKDKKMSTYTDLRNRVKENITVGYAPDDRTTLQKVKFHNEENEYWGTFTGKVSVDDITVDGGALNDVSVYNGYIKNTTLVNADGTKVNLSEIGDQITELSTETIPDLVERISSLESRSGDMPGIMNDIKGLKADMTAISSAISAETKDRIASDESVSSFLSTEFDKKIDDKLAVEAGRITREISDREAADA